MRKVILSILFTFLALVSIAQEKKENDPFEPHHKLGLKISHTQISQGIQKDGKRKWLSLPSWGIDYDYVFHKKFSIGLHNDIIVEDFSVEEHLGGGAELERSYPIASAAVFGWKPGKNFNYLFGCGGEFAHTKNLFLFRVGIEYAKEINRNWEFSAALVNDYKLNAYNAWSVGAGITRVYHKKRKKDIP